MKKWDHIILASIAGVAVVLALVFWLMGSRSQKAYAIVSIDGKTVLTLDLAAEPNRQIDLAEYGVPVVLEIREHRISFLSSDCPDHLCNCNRHWWPRCCILDVVHRSAGYGNQIW